MNILIIGNGFDIAHGLPTTYKEFLQFIKQIKLIPNYYGTFNEFVSPKNGFDKLNEEVAKYIVKLIKDDSKPNVKVKDIYKVHPNEIISEIIQLSTENFWIEWFDSATTLTNDGWIDFEMEISMAVQNFDRLWDAAINLKGFDTMNKSTIEEALKKSGIDINILHFLTDEKNINKILDVLNFSKYRKKMIDDLNRLIRCLELYLEDVIRNIDKSLLSPDIYDLKVDKVLSFNYTDTYDRIYSCKNTNIEYDYIHGKSKISKQTLNNMVLGIDEYLEGDARNSYTVLIEYKKYYQRIHKATGCVYKQWIETINSSKNEEEHNIYIFGHSLASTDKDILNELITERNIKTTIYFKDDKQYGQQIANLVNVLGQDELISMVYGSNPKIRFVLQKPMIDKSNSEWQILNDLKALWNLYNFSDEEIQLIIRRVKEKIVNKDLEYFQNQRNVISLYDALVTQYHHKKNRDTLLEIAKSLYNANICEQFDAKNWNKCDYSGESPCDKEVEKFIIEINKYNMDKNDELKTNFNMDNLEILFEQISVSSIEENKIYELFDSLFLKFNTGEFNIKLIWKCIFSLSGKMPYEKWISFIEKRKAKAKVIDTVRYKHIMDAIEENNYYESMFESIDWDDEDES